MQDFQESMPGQPAFKTASAIIIVSFILALLYFAREVFEPLALAVLLAFVLTPPIRWLRRRHVGRVTPVIAVVALALTVIGIFGLIMEAELSRLAGEVPLYQTNLRHKVASLHDAMVPSGALKRAASTLTSLAEELSGNTPGSAPAKEPQQGERPKPIPVEVQPPAPATLDYLQNLIGPFVTPLTMAGLLVLFLFFILFYQEDLRDRVLRLGGTARLPRTTAAMDDAGRRLSRYFLIQSAINASFGFCIFLGLWAIGVPNPVLWGMLAGILRFVPYVGTPIAALVPLLLAAAIEPGWTKMLATGGLFLGLELITGQAVEPVLQGQHTGLSPLAIILSQLFWTLIWGAPGLLLAVPVTVCIAVLGRHIDGLNFIGVLLGDEPALTPHEQFYERLLVGDATEATFQAEQRLTKEPLSAFYDEVPMAALALAQTAAANGRLPRERQAELCGAIEEVAEDLGDYSDEVGPPNETQAPSTAGTEGGAPILLIAARSALDEAASVLLAQILEKRGLKPSVQPYTAGRARKDYRPPANVRLACISQFGASENPASIRYLIRRLKRVLPQAQFVACFWRFEGDAAELEEWRKHADADFAAASIREAACICRREAANLPEPPELPAPPEELGEPRKAAE